MKRVRKCQTWEQTWDDAALTKLKSELSRNTRLLPCIDVKDRIRVLGCSDPAQLWNEDVLAHRLCMFTEAPHIYCRFNFWTHHTTNQSEMHWTLNTRHVLFCCPCGFWLPFTSPQPADSNKWDYLLSRWPFCVCVCECSFLGGSKWEPTTAFELKINRTLWSATLERTQWCAVDSIENKQFKSRSIVFVQNMRLVLPHMLAGFTGVAFKWHDWSLHLQWPERLLLKLLKETSTTFNSSTLESVQVIWMRDTRTYSIWSDVSEHYSTSLKRSWEPSTT